MPSIVLEDFKTSLYDLCRPNRFQVAIDYPEISFEEKDYFLVKATTIPDKSFGEIELNWHGYKYKVAGDPVFNDITVTFYHDIVKSGESTRDKFEKWMKFISNDETNIKSIHNQYKCKLYIQQLDGKGNIVKTYIVECAHPREISNIELSMDNTDQVEEFTVTFSYSFYTII